MEKLSKKDLDKRIKEYQEVYPNRTLYFTEDGNCFLSQNPAVDHAKKTKQEWMEIKASETVKNDEGLTTEQANEIINTTELNDSSDYKLLVSLAAAVKIDCGKKKADLIEGLAAYKATLIAE